MANKKCPLCKKNLSLQQVNLSLAVYLCEDLNCKYPVGYDCTVVERKLEDMDKSVDLSSEKESEELDDWIHEVVKEKVPETTIDLSNAETENESAEDWIDDLVEEAVNEARRYEASNEVTGDNSASIGDLDDFLDFL
ncbi:hypothetical protein Zmor_027146 [Zophobas morio]|uniref:Uncharacterized protein n=1 Tax=Zophobas morio TaxID=2755281 RepID=A0AA38HMV5_9CUCU|nr:hypothetical protein Zmor_027146 [Zophobas morio]